MREIRTGKDIKELLPLEDKYYIYAMQNEAGKVKIGKTRNILQRYRALSGSNAQGNKIIKVYCISTYLYVIERVMHDKYAQYRIPGTEWFYDKKDPSGDGLFDDICRNFGLLLSSPEFARCERLRGERFDN